MRPCTCNRGIDGPFTATGVLPSDPTYQCRVCWLFHNDERYRKLWTTGEGLVTSTASAQPAIPALPERVSNFQSGLDRWNAAGRPLVSLEVRDERRAKCRACEFRSVDNDTCKVCGCPLSQPPLLGQALAVLTTGKTAASKTEMATERCPLGLPHLPEPYRSMKPRWREAPGNGGAP